MQRVLARIRLWWDPFYDPDGSRRAAAKAAVAADPAAGFGGQWALMNWTPETPADVKETMYFTGGALTAAQERRLGYGRSLEVVAAPGAQRPV